MCDFSGTELLRCKLVTTRKDHHCIECDSNIPAGSKARCETRIPEDGVIFNVWFHPECAEES